MGRKRGTDVKMFFLSCHLISSFVTAGLWKAPGPLCRMIFVQVWVRVLLSSVCYIDVENQIIKKLYQFKKARWLYQGIEEMTSQWTLWLYCFCLVSLCDPRWLVVGLPPLPRSWHSKRMPPMNLLQKVSTNSAVGWSCGFRGHEREKPDTYPGPHRDLKFSYQEQAQGVTNKCTFNNSHWRWHQGRTKTTIGKGKVSSSCN